MGLFDFMRRSFPRGRNESQPRVAKTTPQSCGHKGEILFHGDEESIVYCYDGAPLKGLKEGSEIYLDVLPYDVVMESCDTGTVIDTKEWEIPAVGYLGRPIGTLQFTFDYFKALAFDGYSVKVKAKKNRHVLDQYPRACSSYAAKSRIETVVELEKVFRKADSVRKSYMRGNKRRLHRKRHKSNSKGIENRNTQGAAEGWLEIKARHRCLRRRRSVYAIQIQKICIRGT